MRNGTRIKQIWLLFADQRKAAESAASAFYFELHWATT